MHHFLGIFLSALTLCSACAAAKGSDGADASTSDSQVCKDKHSFNDYKNRVHPLDDMCLDLPFHYCAFGADLATTFACAPDGSHCCQYGDSCTPCGWAVCGTGASFPEGYVRGPANFPPGSPSYCWSAPILSGHANCPLPPEAPDFVCWDGLTLPSK